MMDELALLRAHKNPSSSSKSAYATPPPRVAAPSPGVKSAASPGRPPKPPTGLVAAEIPPPPKSEGGKLARLRRLCEVKPSGRCAVPQEVHQRWKKADKNEREAMVEEFEKANWPKDLI